jgi:hypothetical protein
MKTSIIPAQPETENAASDLRSQLFTVYHDEVMKMTYETIGDRLSDDGSRSCGYTAATEEDKTLFYILLQDLAERIGNDRNATLLDWAEEMERHAERIRNVLEVPDPVETEILDWTQPVPKARQMQYYLMAQNGRGHWAQEGALTRAEYDHLRAALAEKRGVALAKPAA